MLEPLGPRHNESDYAAWTSSIAHIQATPGFPWGSWPHEMTLAENLADLEMHERALPERSGFTYTVLDPESGDVIGCVYIYPTASAVTTIVPPGRSPARRPFAPGCGPTVRTLDVPLWRAVSAWLEADWPFERIEYAPRG